MADLPNNSFVNVNDIETAADAPLTEALAQKYGTNENTNNNEILLLDGRVSALESVTPNVVQNTQASGVAPVNTTTTVSSVVITPGSTFVDIKVDGYFVAGGSADAVVLRRNGIFLTQFVPGSSFATTYPFSVLNFTDTGATANVANTYIVEAVTQIGTTVTYTQVRESVYEIR